MWLVAKASSAANAEDADDIYELVEGSYDLASNGRDSIVAGTYAMRNT